jgi:hypothetical protein
VTTKLTLDENGVVVYEMLFKVKVYSQMNCDHKSSACHFVTGEQKMYAFNSFVTF